MAFTQPQNKILDAQQTEQNPMFTLNQNDYYLNADPTNDYVETKAQTQPVSSREGMSQRDFAKYMSLQ
jgi:hypothetical protein